MSPTIQEKNKALVLLRSTHCSTNGTTNRSALLVAQLIQHSVISAGRDGYSVWSSPAFDSPYEPGTIIAEQRNS